MPEQNLEGYAAVNSLAHYRFQKIPEDENPSDDLVVSPVTGIFTHESTDVWTLHFDNGDSLGVTGSHPIYSLDADGWVLASTLATGNQVLTKSGHAIVTSVNKQSGLQTVYNLEVRALHNCLVGESGVVVHNACSKVFLKELMDDPDFDDILAKLPSGQVKDNLLTLKAWKTATPPDPKYQKFLDDFDVDVPVERVKAWKSFLDEGYEALRKNPDALKALDDAVAEGLDGMDAIQDAIQTLNKNKWVEIKTLFKRGNDFNRKARDNSWWPEPEVTVVHPIKVYPPGHSKAGQPRIFRLDSYDHNLGKRVSRKATDFDEITEQTWLNYLNEIDSKYPEGAIIKRPGSPLNDQALHGERILEVPDSNIGSAKQQAFEQLASDKNITVVYKPE